MVKRVSLARRRQGMSKEAFAEHWLGPHAEIARRIPGLRGYVINLIHDPEVAGWDGIAETWFDSREDALAGFASEPIRSELAADRPLFLDEVRVFFVDEHAVVPLVPQQLGTERVLATENRS
jgi:uncharacterized protein (TIGR02118 family)